MIIRPALRPDWYCWHDLDMDWARANINLPGLQFGVLSEGGQMVVWYHFSHVPCLPNEARIAHGAMYQSLVDLYGGVERVGDSTTVLRNYQYTDLQRFRLHKGVLIAYEMRVGKTALACHLHNPADGPLVVVGPLAAREAWREWIEKTLGAPPWILHGRTNLEPPLDCPAYFCHYDVLDAHTQFLVRSIGTLVCDEFHMLQARGTQRLSAVNALVPQAKRILGLTGTPVWNKPKSLWTLLHLLAPGAWGSRWAFRQRHCNPQSGAHGWRFEGASHTEELQARLKTIMVRRTWKEIMPELPETTRVIEPVAVSGAAYTAIEAATMNAVLARGTPNAAGYQATLRRKLAEVKIKPAIEIACQAVADGHKVVLWVWHNEIGDKVEHALKRVSRLSGADVFRLKSSDASPARDWNVDQFRGHGGPAFLVASMGVGGVSLDLSCSDYAIFAELDWTPAMVYQAEMRTFHKDRPHVVVYLHADDPVETRLITALDAKNSFANALGLGFDDIAKRILT